jgi:hypothetical protein
MNRALLTALLALAAPALADEGMWTLNDFPADKLKAKYGFGPDKAWLDHVRLSSVRLAGGCSASLVSADGLVLTNHHCVRRCVEKLSTPKADYIAAGFYAKAEKDELKCQEFELNQLEAITDVTARLNAATRGAAPEKFFELQKQEMAKIEKECATSDEVRCDVVTLYRGGRYDLYQYRRFQDVRLVFAPEQAAAHFGGDPDNFNFPRYSFDASFLRVYGKDGKKLKFDHFLKFSPAGAREGDLTFVSGNPGGTNRTLTLSQLEFERDVRLPWLLSRIAEVRGTLNEFGKKSKEAARISNGNLMQIENSFKALRGRHAALADKAFFGTKVAEEQALRKKIEADAKLKPQFASAWSEMDKVVERQRQLYKDFMILEGGPGSELFGIARLLVRAADELPKANPERLKEYADARLPPMKQKIASNAPIYDDLEELTLAWGLTKLREELGADHPTVVALLGKQSPEALAKAAVKGSKLKDPKERQKLFDGGKAAIDASKDPMIALARAYDADARAIRKKYEDEIDGPVRKIGEVLAKARVAVRGAGEAPDATFTLRLNYGTVKGWSLGDKTVTPVTTLAGAFARHNGSEPFALPKSWLDAQKKLDGTTPYNFATDNDIIGGNSGSPVINKEGEVVGLIFDGNIHSLGGDYGYDGVLNRAVAVHSAGILAGLRTIYGATRIADELVPAAAPAGGK